MLAALDRHLRWLKLLNYARPWVLSVQVSARRISKTSSPAWKMEETERGKCTDKRRRRRNTLDGKNSRRFQSRSFFSHDVVESNWGQQMFRGSLLLRWPATQMKSHRTTTMKEIKGSIGSYRTSHISRTPQTTNIKQFPRIFSVVFSNQNERDPESKQSKAAIMLLR